MTTAVTGSSTTTRQSFRVDHPYWIAGVVVIVISFIILAFDLGTLYRCGHGNGICISGTGHTTGEIGLLVFAIVFIIGIVLVMYTAASAVTTQTTTPVVQPVVSSPPVTIVPPAAPPTSAPTTVNVNPPRTPPPSSGY
ncbi:MAG: hypothetical protein WA761_00845 [Thermoplasmata archaeon]